MNYQNIARAKAIEKKSYIGQKFGRLTVVSRVDDYVFPSGGRGITICREWQQDYLCFRNWCITHGYKEEIRESGRNDLTIDRIDVNGNYELSNCRFITNKENCLNKRDTLSDSERYKICPICGKSFTVSKRNQKQTCSAKCGQVIRVRKIKREKV